VGSNFRVGVEPLEMNSIYKCLFRLAVVSWLLVVCTVVYWRFLDNPIPVIVHSITILPDEPHHAGDTVTLHVDVCQTLPGVVGTGVRMIRSANSGGFMHFLSESYIDPLPECTRHDRPIVLPRDLAPGPYEYVFQGVYQVNPIKTEVFTQTPVPFEIIQ
jgi:hypothetical protein